MAEEIKKAKKNGDSLGGIIQGAIYGLPIGLGEPTMDKVYIQLNRYKHLSDTACYQSLVSRALNSVQGSQALP